MPPPSQPHLIEPDKLTVEIKKVFGRFDNGYIIASTEEGHTVKGSIHHEPDDIEGEKLTLTGKWVKHPQYGDGFEFTQYEVNGNPDFFFLTKMCKGISKKSAWEIIEKVGDLNRVIEHHPSALLQIKGIGEKKLKSIIETYNKNKEYQSLASVLLPVGLTPQKIRKIHEYFKEKKVDAIVEIRKNPYILTRIEGIGFKRADEIGLMLGKEIGSYERVYNGIIHSLKNYAERTGNTCIEKETLYEESCAVLNTDGVFVRVKKPDAGNVPIKGVPDEGDFVTLTFNLTREQFAVTLSKMEENKEIMKIPDGDGNEMLTIPYIANAELYIREILLKYGKEERSELLIGNMFDRVMVAFQDEVHGITNGFKFGKDQMKALELVNKRYHITCISGLAGSGKTTTSKAILKMYEQVFGYEGIYCCALSGVASARIKEVTGFRSSTIHSMLRFHGGTFEYGLDKKLPYSLILLDEASMVDSYLFASLLKAIDFDRTTLICLGDYGQLRPIGFGRVFRDMIEEDYVYSVELREVFRTSEDKIVNVFATQYVRNGKVPEGYDSGRYSDFVFKKVEIDNFWSKKQKASKEELKEMKEENNKKIVKEIERYSSQFLRQMHERFNKKDIRGYIRTFQVLSPYKKGTVGVFELNRKIQQQVNPYKYENAEELKMRKDVFKLRDKVIHLTNTDMIVSSLETYRKFATEGRVPELKSLADEVNSGVEERRVFNGEMGVIINIMLEEDLIAVYYPESDEPYIALYSIEDFDDGTVQHGYATSVHRSQGSEYENVIIPFTTSHWALLSSDLTYTAMTRMKERLYVIGETFAFKRACENKPVNEKKTVLSLMSPKNGDKRQHR